MLDNTNPERPSRPPRLWARNAWCETERGCVAETETVVGGRLASAARPRSLTVTARMLDDKGKDDEPAP
jgi:hypothetical protein